MELILNHIVPEGNKIIKYGQVDNKLLLELRMTTSLYDYIEVVTNHYDDEEMPYVNNWVDVEGMDYGWRWLRHEEDDRHNMMAQLVGQEAESLERVMDKNLYFVYENEKAKTYHFVGLYSKTWRRDIIIAFSNEELFC